MVKKLSCVSCGSLKRFPHIFTIESERKKEPQIPRPSYSIALVPSIPSWSVWAAYCLYFDVKDNESTFFTEKLLY